MAIDVDPRMKKRPTRNHSVWRPAVLVFAEKKKAAAVLEVAAV